ncbi:MAG: DNA adenine methylase [Minisyncoccota bacterium]
MTAATYGQPKKKVDLRRHAHNGKATPVLSPLRYPGAKRWLAQYISETLQHNGKNPDLFVELFAGGAAVGLHLLATDAVGKVLFVDVDPMITSFWQAVFHKKHRRWLTEQIKTVDISLEQWKKFKHGKFRGVRQKALQCLFLNRTSFSGILSPRGGALGGMKQASAYKIDCRFPREEIIRRIEAIGRYEDRVAGVWNMSWEQALEKIREERKIETHLSGSVFFYLDPPFFEKAEKLYTFYFDDDDHVRLRDSLFSMNGNPWVLSYDLAKRAVELYGNMVEGKAHRSANVSVQYYTSRQNGERKARSEIILSNIALPMTTSRKNGEKGDPSGHAR